MIDFIKIFVKFILNFFKDNIEVHFLATGWKFVLESTKFNVYYQYGISLKTPPYQYTNIQERVEVDVQLFRPSDSAVSNPVKFYYKPPDECECKRKRPRIEPAIDDIDRPDVREPELYGGN